jgi:hypothetical protein
MKLIKSPRKEIAKPIVGNTVKLAFHYDDGRVVETFYEDAKVIKVNRVTFDAKTEDGDVYRMKFDDPDFRGIKA